MEGGRSLGLEVGEMGEGVKRKKENNPKYNIYIFFQLSNLYPQHDLNS